MKLKWLGIIFILSSTIVNTAVAALSHKGNHKAMTSGSTRRRLNQKKAAVPNNDSNERMLAEVETKSAEPTLPFPTEPISLIDDVDPKTRLMRKRDMAVRKKKLNPKQRLSPQLARPIVSSAKKRSKLSSIVTPSKKSSSRSILSPTVSRSLSVFRAVISPLLSLLAKIALSYVDFKNRAITRISILIFSAYLLCSQLLIWYLKAVIDSNVDDVIELSPSSASSVLGSVTNMFGQSGDLLKKLTGRGSLSSSQQGPKVDVEGRVRYTARSHDMQQVDSLTTSLVIEAAITTYSYLVGKATNQLVLTPLVGIVDKLVHPLVLIHVFGYESTGDLKRPFKSKVEKMMETFFGSGNSDGVDHVVEQKEGEEEVEFERRHNLKSGKAKKGGGSRRSVSRPRRGSVPVSDSLSDDSTSTIRSSHSSSSRVIRKHKRQEPPVVKEEEIEIENDNDNHNDIDNDDVMSRGQGGDDSEGGEDGGREEDDVNVEDSEEKLWEEIDKNVDRWVLDMKRPEDLGSSRG